MSDETMSDESAETKTEGAIKAGDGEYFWDLEELAGIDANPDYTSAHGVVVEGERTLVGLMRMPAGTEAGMHTHPNEQFLYVREGTFEFEVDGQEATMTEGSLVYIPADAPHRSRVVGDEDVVFFTGKDLRSGIGGTPVDEASERQRTPEESTGEDDRETLTEGGIRAGDGNYFFELGDLDGVDAGPEYTTAHGTVIEGDRILVGLMHSSAGSGARMHTHPNEQFSYWVQGTSHNVVDDQEASTSEGMLRYVPPEMEHKAHATGDEDVYFFTVKDRSHSISGIPVDQSTEGAYYEDGRDPETE